MKKSGSCADCRIEITYSLFQKKKFLHSVLTFIVNYLFLSVPHTMYPHWKSETKQTAVNAVCKHWQFKQYFNDLGENLQKLVRRVDLMISSIKSKSHENLGLARHNPIVVFTQAEPWSVHQFGDLWPYVKVTGLAENKTRQFTSQFNVSRMSICSSCYFKSR